MKLKIEKLEKFYHSKKVLDIDNLELTDGKFYGVVGDNGVGKSTLFRIIAGLEKSTHGTILYDGQEWNEGMGKEITYMAQIPLMMKTTVYHNIAYPLKIRKFSNSVIQTKVEQLMEELDLYKLKDQMATELSGGEAQKVAFARALIFEPKLLLMDEPTSHIDYKTIDLIEKIIRRREVNSMMTTLMITHNVIQKQNLFDKVIEMQNGSIKKN